MENTAKLFLYILPIALCADIIIPLLLGPFYKGYSQLYQVMSVLGNHHFILHRIYNTWLVILGLILIAGSVQLYNLIVSVSMPMAIALMIILILYAVGGCILSGLFSVGEDKSLETLPAKIHGIGSAIGFMILTLAGLTVSVYFHKINALAWMCAGAISFLCSVIFFVLFIMADKPAYADSILSLEGLWQRLSLVFMYVPIILLCFYLLW
ncbi:DUF998 domain-containing protein [Diplocloster modestus]|uniref:DUF998 domain-containing protein n=1 Tax=Diplocloster modestus TaxID=2850322 RepID=A0ABS6K4F3_9FIRM|nr:DUF998 domain-containing protein [Diplocloster modestus]MBU9725378.1 DUF998 domain-containing protein [Diplocloster modestus]